MIYATAAAHFARQGLSDAAAEFVAGKWFVLIVVLVCLLCWLMSYRALRIVVLTLIAVGLLSVLSITALALWPSKRKPVSGSAVTATETPRAPSAVPPAAKK
jgi:fatty acid desaturase